MMGIAKGKKKSFYRPYKGLKHFSDLTSNTPEACCFYRPYKGLKPKIAYSVAKDKEMFLSSL